MPYTKFQCSWAHSFGDEDFKKFFNGHCNHLVQWTRNISTYFIHHNYMKFIWNLVEFSSAIAQYKRSEYVEDGEQTITNMVYPISSPGAFGSSKLNICSLGNKFYPVLLKLSFWNGFRHQKCHFQSLNDGPFWRY